MSESLNERYGSKHFNNADKAGLAMLIVGLLAVGGYAFIPRKIEGPVRVNEKKSYVVQDPESGYSEDQYRIKVDKHSKCIRGHKPFAEDLQVGDTLEYIKWRPGLTGPCDYSMGYKKKN